MPYFSFALAIALWWFWAFQEEATSLPLPPTIDSIQSFAKKLPLSPLPRNALIQGLHGDLFIMEQLLQAWWEDHETLLSLGLDLSPWPIEEKTQAINLFSFLKYSKSQAIDLTCFPQSFVAATFLLALAPERIVALPSGFRSSQLFDKNILEAIPEELEGKESEKLFTLHPSIAFVAPYSHPSAIESLKAQEIKTYSLTSASSIEEMLKSLNYIGEILGCPEKAALLALFTRGALRNLAARLKACEDVIAKRLVLMTAYLNYAIPTLESWPCQILKSLGLKNNGSDERQRGYSYPISREMLLSLKPEILLGLSADPSKHLACMAKDPELTGLPAWQNGKVFFLDHEIWNSPTQFTALAAYDLVQAIASESL